MSKIVDVLRLTRIEHSVMLVIAVVAAEMITKTLPNWYILTLSIITPIFISMAAFAINDYFDIEVDMANMRKRPLVKGTLKPSDALHITVVGIVIGVISSAFINVYCLIIAILFGLLSVLYSYRLKRMLLWGNMYIAFSMSIPFIFGNFVVSSNISAGIALVSIMIFISGVAREIHGTIRDVKGDRKRNAQTMPIRFGTGFSAVVALILYFIAILISAYLIAFVHPFKYNVAFIIPILITDMILAFVSIGYLMRSSRGFYDLSRNLSLVAMAVALLAILVAPI